MSQLDAARMLAAKRAYSGKTKRESKKSATGLNREELVRKYTPLVYRIAKRVRRRTGYAVELDDLICEGTIGLLQAAERFDPGRETDFEHLASVRVHGAMLDSLRRLDPLSQRRRRQARKHRKVEEKLSAALGRAPTSDEMAEALGLELEDFHRLHHELSTQAPMSLEDVPGDVRDRSDSGEQTIEERDRARKMRGLIELLPERQRLVLSLIYFNELSQKEVSKVLQVTEARVSQLHKEALDKLRRKMASKARPNEDAW